MPLPLGKQNRYLDIMKQVVDENEENREVNRVLSSQQRYIFQKEKSMVLPERIAMECLKNMKLNIYVD